MPRKCSMSEVILTPKMRRLYPFLACFFDLPLKNVLQVLNVSHHTLDPIRRSMGMKKWPFADIVHGKYMDRNQIVALRAQMMPNADRDMQRVLCRVATCAEEIWNQRKNRARRSRRRLDCKQERDASPEPTKFPAQPPPTPSEDECSGGRDEEEETTSFQSQASTSFPQPAPHDDVNEEEFWNDISALFGLSERGFPNERPLFSQ